MGDYWVSDMLGILLDAGCRVAENSITDGWQHRSRSSGGFPSAPLGVQWHHTASNAHVESDLSYMINGSPDNPVGNVLLDRIGVFWPVAAGAANTSGKGGPSTFSRGVCPLDSGNTHLFSIEIACDGVGGPYSQETIDAAFRGSNALNAHFGNQPDDVITHASYTTRKIDPATAAAVQGPWRPASVNSSGTWDVDDLRHECKRRAGSTPPQPSPTEEVTMYVIAVSRDGWPGPVDLVVSDEGTRWNQNGHTSALDRLAGVPRLEVDKEQTLGLLIDRPGIGPCPFQILPAYADIDLAGAW